MVKGNHTECSYIGFPAHKFHYHKVQPSLVFAIFDDIDIWPRRWHCLLLGNEQAVLNDRLRGA